jgi:hypothetical protein
MDDDAVPHCPINSGHTRAICNAFAMWDVIDRPTGDDDLIETAIDLGHVIHVLRTYPTCTSTITSRCVHENDLTNGMNWRDYRHNHVQVWGESGDMTTIQGLNRLNASDDG